MSLLEAAWLVSHVFAAHATNEKLKLSIDENNKYGKIDTLRKYNYDFRKFRTINKQLFGVKDF